MRDPFLTVPDYYEYIKSAERSIVLYRKQQYTATNTGNPDFHRAIVTNCADYFIKPTSASEPEKKTLILANTDAVCFRSIAQEKCCLDCLLGPKQT